MSDNVVRDTLDLDEDQLLNLLKRIFGRVYLDNYQKSLVWQFCRSAVPIQVKL